MPSIFYTILVINLIIWTYIKVKKNTGHKRESNDLPIKIIIFSGAGGILILHTGMQ